MATEKEIGFKINVNGVEKSITNLKELKAELKAAKEAALFGDGAAAKRVAELKDKINDLNDSTKTFAGSGLEKANSGFSLLKEGVANLDFDKIKIALKGLRSALAATGIMLLVQGVMYLIENFKELSQGSGVLGKALRLVGDIISKIGDAITWLTDAIGLTNSEIDKMGEAIKTNADKATEALSKQTAEYDRQIKVAQAAGKSTVELEKEKQKAIIETNKKVVEQIIAFVRAGGVMNDEQKKLLTQSLENIKAAKVEEKVIELKDNKDKVQKANEFNKQLRDLRIQNMLDTHEKEIALENARYQDALKAAKGNKKLIEQLQLQHFNNLADIENKYIDAEEKAKKEREDKAKAELEKKQKEDADKIKKYWEDYNKQQNEAVERDLEWEKEKAANREQILNTSLEASKSLTDAYFQTQLNRAKGNAEAELKIRKQMFQVDKAFNVARVIQDGIRSVQAALTIPPPGGQILAGVNAALAAGNLAKILATKFDGGNISGGSAGSSTPSISTQAPVIPTPTNSSGFVNQDTGKIEPQKSYVVESEISEKQKKISTIINQNKF